MTSEPSDLMAAATLTVWCGCVAVGVVGLCVPYPRPRPEVVETAAVEARVIHVEIAGEAVPQPAAGNPSAPSPQSLIPMPASPPPLLAAVVTPDAPRLEAVAEPEVEMPFVRQARAVAPPQAAAVSRAPAQMAAAEPVVAQITFGVGEGRQAAPEYPREAVIDREQGTIVVRFTVGEDGGVVSADAIKPCNWPLLNQAAVRAVRETWRFSAGARRIYEVPIQFQLRHH